MVNSLLITFATAYTFKRALACVWNRTTISKYCSSSNYKTTWTKTRSATRPVSRTLTGSNTVS